MEKILESIIDEITARVLKKLEDNTSSMHNFLNLKVKAENVEGLAAFIDEQLDSCDLTKSNIRDLAANAGEDAAIEAIKNANFSVDVSF